jgi:hypothetical protein
MYILFGPVIPSPDIDYFREIINDAYKRYL